MGYAFGVMEFPGRKYIYALVLIGFMVPFEAMVLPLYQYLHALKLTDTYWALILPQIGLSISFGTLWMTSFYKNSERELQDAAAMDGCNRIQTLWFILIPIAIPAILTLVVLIFMWTWNEFLLALGHGPERNPCGPYLLVGVFPGSLHIQYPTYGGRLIDRCRTNHYRLLTFPALFYPWIDQRRCERIIHQRR